VPNFAQVHFYKVNLAMSNQVEELWNKIVAEHGPIHILVNNAAICNGRSISDLSLGQFKLTMEINFMSYVQTTMLFLKQN
jgi:NAD(P)-dependent dehydrogenase (short-subunit alcohol dehydrogenase family)